MSARANRVILGIIGVILVVMAAYAFTRGLKVRPQILGEARTPFLPDSARAFAHDHNWFWPVVGAATIVVALLGLWWLAAQARPRSLRALRMESDTRKGVTAMPAHVLTSTVEDDLSDGPDLRRPSASLNGSVRGLRMGVTAGLAPHSDPAAVRGRLHQALDRMRDAMETDELPTVVKLRG
jgi:hypothetical protein